LKRELGAQVICLRSWLSPALNTAALEETYVFGYVYSQEETFFQGIKQIFPGSGFPGPPNYDGGIAQYFLESQII
jgi:hypothetical protein